MKNKASLSSSLATGALACFCMASVGLLLMHVLRADYQVASHMISDYAVGEFGGVMVAVFVTWSIGMALLSAALLLAEPSTLGRKVGSLLLGIKAAGLLVSAAYRTDLPDLPDAHEGNVHAISFFVNIVCMLVAIPVLSLRRGMPYGLTNRLFVVVLLAWLIGTAARLRRSLLEGEPDAGDGSAIDRDRRAS